MQIRKICDKVCEGYYSWKENLQQHSCEWRKGKLICNSIPKTEAEQHNLE